MHARSWDSIESEQLSDEIARQAIHGEQATIARFRLARGAVVRRHEHANEQITSVVDGALVLRFDDRDIVVRSGEVLVIPPHVPHAAEALEDTLVIDFFAPRREDWINKDDAYLRR